MGVSTSPWNQLYLNVALVFLPIMMIRPKLMAVFVALALCAGGCAKPAPIAENQSENDPELSLASVQKFCATHIRTGDAIADALHVCEQRGWHPIWGPTDRVYGCLIKTNGPHDHKILVSIYMDKDTQRVRLVEVKESFTYL